MLSTVLKGLALSVCLLLSPVNGQVAVYAFDNESTASSDTDPRSTASSLHVNKGHMFAEWPNVGWFICLDPTWETQQEQGPFNQSQNYLEMTVTPNAGDLIWLTALTITTGIGSNPNVDVIGVYADEDPGVGGDNFQTRVGLVSDIYPQGSGLHTSTVGLDQVPFLQGVSGPVTVRVYFWTSGSTGHSFAEIERLTLEGCAGVIAIAQDLGAGCGLVLDPVFTATAPALGGVCTLDVQSAFPNALGFLFASVPPVAPFPLPGTPCVVYVDILNLQNLILITAFWADGNGAWQAPVPIPNDVALMGYDLIMQVRLCAPTGPVGPLNPDWISNGLYLRIGCAGAPLP
jgi:hypothetical protein